MVKIAQKLEKALFINRENRFVGTIKIHNRVEKCHIMNPGRMIHFLIPGAQVLVEDRSSPTRKLRSSLLYVLHPDSLILIDSQLPNAIVNEGLHNKKLVEFNNVQKIQREIPYGTEMRSRIDFLLDDSIYLEVKATNYVENQIGYFPDAPTKRGQKHLQELMAIQNSQNGIQTYVLFLAQRTDIEEIRPFEKIDPKFTRLLHKAKKSGTEILGYSINFKKNGSEVYIGSSLPIEL